MKYNAVIFSVGGLLLNAGLVYYEVSQVVVDRTDFSYDKDLHLKFLGVSDEEVWASYHMIFVGSNKTSVQRFIDDSYQETLGRFSQEAVQTKPGVLELPPFLEERQISKVVASSNQRVVIELLLKESDLFERFKTITSAENVQRVKPDLEAFLLVNQKLGTVKKETLILEDSQDGILTASVAETSVVMVPDLFPPSQELIKKTAEVISSLREIPASTK